MAAGTGGTGGDTVAAGWSKAFEDRTKAAFGGTFASDVVLEAATLHEPVVGLEAVRSVMAAASGIYGELVFTDPVTSAARTFLEWRATAADSGTEYRGVTVLTANADGAIEHIAIHHRPLGSALQFSAELGRRLDGVVPAKHFFQEA
ncbi:hypothetical protein Psed_4068 [Pseudonocardia dioxanivorans CB1190]|uniref:SnoaL-like domain-containing protein n=1 Tax=Pseudonocardia dioxanivorans (strain ATCC 55486 / DSM 44775 / JCM 13855 / CB1190) TaxID=675635 RepID=F4CRM3_PSEUX|nr:nuclear transport factor 2 family protein [Pseudonocardia dioxanivorans]AEA26231.1 hypothetical protein Psed_4068 [Pseudonocardia dioxanivorans CB1190]